MSVDSRQQFEELSGMDEGDEGYGVEPSNGGRLRVNGGGLPGGDHTVGNFVDYCFHFG